MNRALLEQHFTPDQIKQRQGERGETLDYIEGATVIQRLNDAFGSEWSFEIIEHVIQEKEVLVLGRLTAGGITKTQFGNKTREASVGDDLKAAATDAIKKCATLFGIGLHLYFDEKTIVAPEPPARQYVPVSSNGNGNGNGSEYARPYAAPLPLPRPNPPRVPPPPTPPGNISYSHDGGNGNGNGDTDGRLTAKQLSAIFGISKGAGWASKQTREYSKARFGKLPDFLTKKEASAFIDHLKGGAS